MPPDAVPRPVPTRSEPIRVLTERALVSRTSILILSGVLIGMAAGRLTHTTAELPAFVAGVMGLLSYLVIESLVKRRQDKAQKVRELSLQALETRLNRHLSHAHDPYRQRPHMHRANMAQQYLPVVTSWNSRD